MGFRGRQDYYDAYVEDFSIFQMADGNRIERKSDENETRRAEKSNTPLSSVDVVDGRSRERSRGIV